MKYRAREKYKPCYEGGVLMNTRFEINIQKISVKGDDQFLYLYISDVLVLKTAYKDIKAITTKVRYQLRKYLISDEDS